MLVKLSRSTRYLGALMGVGGSGGGGGGSVPDERVFADLDARQAWTATNASSLEPADECIVLDDIDGVSFYAWTGFGWNSVDKIYQGLKGSKGDDGASMVSVAFSGDDILVGLSDGSTIPLEGGKSELTGDSVASVAFDGLDMVFYDENNVEIDRILDAANTLRGARGQSFFVRFARTSAGPWSDVFDSDPVSGSFFWQFSYDNKNTWTEPQPCRQLTTVNIENPITLDLGNVKLGSSGDSFAIYNADRRISGYPVMSGIYDDGTTVRAQELVPDGPKVLNAVFGGAPSGVAVDCDYTYNNPFSAAVLATRVLPMETYSGKINVDVYSNSGELISRHVQTVNVTVGQPAYLSMVDGPKQVAEASRTYRMLVTKTADNQPLQVQGSDNTGPNPGGPHRAVDYQPLAYRQSLAVGDYELIFDELNNAPEGPGLNAEKVKGIEAFIENKIGTDRGNIDFSGDLSQFSPANKSDYWTAVIASGSESIGGLTFNNGDRLIAVQSNDVVPTTLNSPSWRVDPKTVPQASATTLGGVKISTTSALEINASTGNLDVKAATANQAGALKADAVGGAPTIGPDGKLKRSVIPVQTGTQTKFLTLESELLTLPITSDAYIVNVSSTSRRWGLDSNADPSKLENWALLGVFGDSVTSFNDRPGDVEPLAGDYDADMVDETVDRVFMTPAQSGKLDRYNETARYADFETDRTYEKYDRVRNAAGFIIEANKRTPANAVPLEGDWDVVSYDYVVVESDRNVGEDKAHMSYVVPATRGATTLRLATAFPTAAHSYDIYVRGDRDETTEVKVQLTAGVTAGPGTDADGYRIRSAAKLEVRCDASQVNVNYILLDG